MPYTVIFTPDSEAQLTELYRYIADASSPGVATHYTNSIVTYCESLQALRGIQRDDISRSAHNQLPKTLCDHVRGAGDQEKPVMPHRG